MFYIFLRHSRVSKFRDYRKFLIPDLFNTLKLQISSHSAFLKHAKSNLPSWFFSALSLACCAQLKKMSYTNNQPPCCTVFPLHYLLSRGQSVHRAWSSFSLEHLLNIVPLDWEKTEEFAPRCCCLLLNTLHLMYYHNLQLRKC